METNQFSQLSFEAEILRAFQYQLEVQGLNFQ